MEDSNEAKPFTEPAVEDVEMLVGVTCEEAERLIFSAENVQPWEVGGEDERGAVGEDQHERDFPYDAYHSVEDVDAEECEDEQGGGVLWEGLVEERYGWRLVGEERS
jgi:hypothetical protein